MSNMPDIAALQGELLDAALMPAEWYPTLGKLQHGFEASHCDLYLMQGETLLFAAGVGIDVSMSEYIERFIDREPRSLELRHLKTGEVTTDRQFASRKILNSHDYYAEFLPRHGLSGCVAASVLNTPTRRAYFGLHYQKGRWEFDDDLLATVGRLQPMLARAVNLQFRLAGSDVVDALRKEALDRVPQGMLALDVHGRILLMNDSAQSAVADRTAFRVRNGRLQCADTAVQARLEVCIKDALRRRGSQGGVLLAGRGLTRYSLMVTPARTESRDESAAFVLVFIARLGADHTDASIAQFQALFSLTLSEARIAAGLVRGRALKDLATQLRMTYESARFLLKQIFAKVGVHTQAGLVALLSEALHRPPVTREEAEPDGDV